MCGCDLNEPISHKSLAAASVAPLASSKAAGGVIYKVALLTHKVGATATPAYLSDLVQAHVPTRALRSSDAQLLVVPRTQTEIARRTFSVATPSIWNTLSADIRLCESVSTFKRHLKTHLFRLSHLVLLCCKRLCIFGPQSAIQMCYYYYY